jgi:hypothetical protein
MPAEKSFEKYQKLFSQSAFAIPLLIEGLFASTGMSNVSRACVEKFLPVLSRRPFLGAFHIEGCEEG